MKQEEVQERKKRNKRNCVKTRPCDIMTITVVAVL